MSPLVKNPNRFSFWYPQTSLILFCFNNFLIWTCFEHPGPGFVFWENSANFSKIKNHFLEMSPCVKNPNRFSFRYPQTSLILFPFERILMASTVGPGSCVWGLLGSPQTQESCPNFAAIKFFSKGKSISDVWGYQNEKRFGFFTKEVFPKNLIFDFWEICRIFPKHKPLARMLKTCSNQKVY